MDIYKKGTLGFRLWKLMLMPKHITEIYVKYLFLKATNKSTNELSSAKFGSNKLRLKMDYISIKLTQLSFLILI